MSPRSGRPKVFSFFLGQFWPQPAAARPVQSMLGWFLGHGIPSIFLSSGQPGQSLACGQVHPGFQADFGPGLPQSGQAQAPDVGETNNDGIIKCCYYLSKVKVHSI